MDPKIYSCKMGLGKVTFTLMEDEISVKAALGSPVIIPKRDLKKIDFKNVSNPVPGMGYCFYLYFYYNSNGKEKIKKYILSYEDEQAKEMMTSFQEMYPNANYIAPNDAEKKWVLSPDYRNTYRLHGLFGSVVIGLFFLVFGIMTVMGFATKEPGMIFNLVFLGLSLLTLVYLVLVIAKKRYFLSSDYQGITAQKLFIRVQFEWNQLKIGKIQFKEDVYRGDYGSKSTDAYFIIPILKNDIAKTAYTLKMTNYQAGDFAAELYYRGKIDLDTAKQMAAFF